MLTLTKIQTNHSLYNFVEGLLHQSFPVDERRDDDVQRYNTDHNPAFNCYLITDEEGENETAIGLITVWELNGFRYVEHLATSPKVRNKGYGKRIMETLKDEFPGTIILEVERPKDEMSIRRIEFYKRCGFSLCLQDYIQPPYRKGGNNLPLYLMYSGTASIDEQYPEIRDEIYRKVYDVK